MKYTKNIIPEKSKPSCSQWASLDQVACNIQSLGNRPSPSATTPGSEKYRRLGKKSEHNWIIIYQWWPRMTALLNHLGKASGSSIRLKKSVDGTGSSANIIKGEIFLDLSFAFLLSKMLSEDPITLRLSGLHRARLLPRIFIPLFAIIIGTLDLEKSKGIPLGSADYNPTSYTKKRTLKDRRNWQSLWSLGIIRSSRSAPSRLGLRQAASLCNDLQEDRIRNLNQ